MYCICLDQNGHCRWEQKVQFRTSSGHLGCKQCPPEQLNALELKAMAWHLLCITSSVILIFTHLSCIATWKTLWVSLVQAGEIHTSVTTVLFLLHGAALHNFFSFVGQTRSIPIPALLVYSRFEMCGYLLPQHFLYGIDCI